MTHTAHWPAEWETHAATWVSWPHNVETWPGKFPPVPHAFVAMVQAIAECEPVHLLLADEHFADAAELLGDVPNVEFHDIPTNDAWIRDYGPTFVVEENERLAYVDWTYNGWGEKYPPFDLDAAAARQIGRRRGAARIDPQMVSEGGAIEGNGRGVVLTTESCLLNPTRNASLTKADVEGRLRRHLGAEKVLWLPGGPFAGDDTDGHIDQLARFVNETTIVAVVENRVDDRNHLPLRRNFDMLTQMTDAQGRPFEVVELPLPRPLYFGGQRLPASYCNFYIANGLVLVPTFDDAEADERAIKTLSEWFPDREVRGLSAVDLVLGLGAFHCLTQQEPLIGSESS